MSIEHLLVETGQTIIYRVILILIVIVVLVMPMVFILVNSDSGTL